MGGGELDGGKVEWGLGVSGYAHGRRVYKKEDWKKKMNLHVNQECRDWSLRLRNVEGVMVGLVAIRCSVCSLPFSTTLGTTFFVSSMPHTLPLFFLLILSHIHHNHDIKIYMLGLNSKSI